MRQLPSNCEDSQMVPLSRVEIVELHRDLLKPDDTFLQPAVIDVANSLSRFGGECADLREGDNMRLTLAKLLVGVGKEVGPEPAVGQ
jgi:hypothetical protein